MHRASTPSAGPRPSRPTGRRSRPFRNGAEGRPAFCRWWTLYRTTPQVAANQAQGQDAIDVYLGAAAKPVEQLVDIAKVPLTHPAGRPHDTSAHRPDAHALYLHYARVGVDPALAHNGDPLPMETQPKLQQATRMADGSEIPLGIPGIYRGYDDGYFYAANDGTKESPEVQALRRKLATEKAQAQGDASAMAANDNDPEIDEAVARSYGKVVAKNSEQVAIPQAAQESRSSAYTPEEAKIRLDIFASAIEKTQAGLTLSEREQKISDELIAAAATAGQELDLKKIDLKAFKQDTSPIMAVLTAGAATLPMFADAGTMGGGAIAGGVALPILGFASLPLAPLIIGRLLGVVPPPRENKLHMFSRAPYPDIATEERMLRNGRVVLGANLTPESKPEPSSDGNVPPKLHDQLAKDFVSPSNDNYPDPANDNDPSRGPNIGAGTAITAATAGLLASDEERPVGQFTPLVPERFDPDSSDEADFQNDFAASLLNGQLPEIWLDGKRLTPPNPDGMRGGLAARKLDEEAAKAVEEALNKCREVSNVRQVGGASQKQFRISDVEAKGNSKSVTLDLSFAFNHGDFKCMYHLNGVDTNARGLPSTREWQALTRTADNIDKIHRLAGAISKKTTNLEAVKESGYASDWIKKPDGPDDLEINELIKDFVSNVFSCSRIVRECWRTQPTK
jgi:hypothetical protein